MQCSRGVTNHEKCLMEGTWCWECCTNFMVVGQKSNVVPFYVIGANETAHWPFFLIGIFQHHKSASGPLWIAQLWSHWFHSLIINPLIKKHDYKSQLTELWGTYESLKANVTYRCHTIWSRSVWPSIWGHVYVWHLHFFIVFLASLTPFSFMIQIWK